MRTVEVDWGHVIIAVAGAVTAIFTYLSKRLESKKLQAVVDGVDDAAKDLSPEIGKTVKDAIQSQAEGLGVQKALHIVVKAREKVRNGS